MSEAVSVPSERTLRDTYIGIADAGQIGQITLRGDLTSSDVVETVRNTTGLEVPSKLRVSHSSTGRVVWMSPDELLLIGEYDKAEAETASLSTALAGTHHMALNVSDARSMLRLSGPLVGEVLAKGAPCDVSDHGFPPGTARRTHLGGLAIGLWRLAPEEWEIICFRSYAHHLVAWLEQAAQPGSQVGA